MLVRNFGFASKEKRSYCSVMFNTFYLCKTKGASCSRIGTSPVFMCIYVYKRSFSRGTVNLIEKMNFCKHLKLLFVNICFV